MARRCTLLFGLLTACAAAEPLDSESAPVTVEERRLELSDARDVKRVDISTGVEIEYVERGRRSGKPVILIHGYTDSHHSFDRNLPLFSRRYHVYALDLRGHGDSSKPSCCYSQADFAADVVAFLDALGLDKASLVGHSMGSFVAHRVAVDYPERVDKLVLIGSAPTVAGNPIALELESVVDTLVDPIDPVFVREFQASTFFRPIPASFLDTAVEESLKVPATVWQQALAGLIADDHSALLPEVDAKTLILYGAEDVFFTADEQLELTSLIERSALITYRATGHGTHVERPRRVVKAIERFLR